MPKDGTQTEEEIVQFLDSSPGPLTAYDIQKRLNYTSGRVQSALKRLVSQKKIIRKQDWDNTHRRKRIVVWTRDFTPGRPATSETETGLDPTILQSINEADMFDHPQDKQKVVVPVILSRFEADLLSAIPVVNRTYSDLTKFIEKAIFREIKKQTDNIKTQAIVHLVGQGTITLEEGANFLGIQETEIEDIIKEA